MTMRRFYLLGFGALMVFDTWTQVSFKMASASAGEFTMTTAWLKAASSTPWILGAMVGYLGAFVTWMTLLKHAPVGPAFAASHLEVVTVLVICRLFFDERLSHAQIVGAVCIVAGIVFLSLGEGRQRRA